MRYRILGRTGLEVSEIGIGGHEYRRHLNPHQFPVTRNMKEFLKTQPRRTRLIRKALDAGVNFFDTTLEEEAESLGLALKTLRRRKEVYVAVMTVFPFREMMKAPRSRWKEIAAQGIEKRLGQLQSDYIDIFNVHMPEDNYSTDLLKAMVEVLEEMKHEGKVRYVGASSHNLRFLVELMRKYDYFDSVMVPYNYHEQQAREIIFPLCKALNVGTVVMKPLSWPYYGIPFMCFCPANLRTGPYTPAQASLRWTLNSPEVSTVVPSANSVAELQENIGAIDKEGRIDERILRHCLAGAQGKRGREKLRELLKSPKIDIRSYARKALEA